MTSTTAIADDFWVPRRRLSLRQARNRSDLVRLLRMLFTSAAAISAGILIGSLGYSVYSGRDAGPRIGDTQVIMQNPRFSGRDASGQPYVITADTAQRNGANPSLIELSNPALDDGLNGTVQAPTGTFDQDAQQLELFEDVILTDAGGNRFVTTHARMFVQENRVVGMQPLEGVGPLGKIRADTYEIVDGGSRIILRGNVWTEIEPGGRETGE
ncbi:MAG: hypothetical protein CMK07_07400 [Ponticaulis sp.]|nr:hypothetical protein [Ponticaulis sp.]